MSKDWTFLGVGTCPAHLYGHVDQIQPNMTSKLVDPHSNTFFDYKKCSGNKSTKSINQVNSLK